MSALVIGEAADHAGFDRASPAAAGTRGAVTNADVRSPSAVGSSWCTTASPVPTTSVTAARFPLLGRFRQTLASALCVRDLMRAILRSGEADREPDWL
jgi:hypothetical protein